MKGAKSKFGAQNDRKQTKISSFFKPNGEEKKEVKDVSVRSKLVVGLRDSEDDDDLIPPTPLRPLTSNTPNKRLSPTSSILFPSIAGSSSAILSPDFISPSQKPTLSPEFVPPTPTSPNHIRRTSKLRKGFDSKERSFSLKPSNVEKCSMPNVARSLRSSSLRLQVKRKLVEDDDFQLTKYIRPLKMNGNASKATESKESSRFPTLNLALLSSCSKFPRFPPPLSPVSSSSSSHPPLLSYCSNVPSFDNPSFDVPSSRVRSPSPVPVPLSDSSLSLLPSIVDVDDKDRIVATKQSCVESLGNETPSDQPNPAVNSAENEEWNISDFENSFSKTSPKKSSVKKSSCTGLGRRFGRHVVVGVQRNKSGVTELILNLLCEDDSKKERQCILRGYWTDTIVREGDIVNVLADFEDDLLAVVDDNSGVLVVNPDLLLSGTSVVSTLFCSRKAVFGEWFRAIDKGNKSMVVGNLIHQLFQDSIVSRFATEAEIRQRLTAVMNRSENLLARFALRDDCAEELLTNELVPFVAQIHTFMNNHLERRSGVTKRAGPPTNVVITGVHDIEENIWSPRFGLKGKLDLTVEVKIHDLKGTSKKVVPLELKTGRPSFSAEHSGQVTLYSMMSGDRRVDPESGVLLYIKDGRMKVIPADRRARQGLMQMRNGLANYLANPIVSSGLLATDDATMNDGVRYGLASLAAPLSEQKLCTRCPYLTTCAVHHQVSSSGSKSVSNHPFNELASKATSHLTKSDLEYFSHWCTCLFLEKTASVEGAVDLKNVWVMNADERELQGHCLNNMILIPLDTEPDIDTIRVTHRFAKNPDLEKKTDRLSDVGISINQMVVVSIEARNSIALSMGIVLVVTDSWIDVKLDRNLYKVADYNGAVFRIDDYASTSIITSCLTNVARLMSDCEVSKTLRKIVIERRPASFRSKIGKNGVVKAKAILRSLNKEQQSAVLKCLMTEDYLLIKGMPGAGKTATIVALIRVLSEMGHSVLLTSHTHTAVDNVLFKLEEKGLDFLRLGSTTRIDAKLLHFSAERLISNVKSLEELNELFNSKCIVATTCLGANHSLLSGGRRFDYCIVDEASQILQPACLGPLFHCHKFILVGDHHQLPPIVRSQEGKNVGMDESLFYRLDSPHSTVELSFQYRMNSEINRLANCLTYKDSLKCATDEVSKNVLKLSDVSYNKLGVSWLSDVLSSDMRKSVLLLDTSEVPTQESRDSNGQLCNQFEVDLVAVLVAVLTKFGLDEKDLGVICPYRNQVSHVVTALKDRQLPSVEVNTVDQYQGRDKDVIVMSFVRSNSYPNSTLPSEILNDKRRINVAITRARKKLILIGNSKTLVRYGPIKTLLDSLTTTQRIVVPHSIESNVLQFVNENKSLINAKN